MEDSIHNSGRVIWTNYNVLWTYKLSSNVLNNDEWDSIGLDQHWRSSEFHWSHYNRNGKGGRIWWGYKRCNGEISRKWFIYKTIKM